MLVHQRVHVLHHDMFIELAANQCPDRIGQRLRLKRKKKSEKWPTDSWKIHENNVYTVPISQNKHNRLDLEEFLLAHVRKQVERTILIR